MNNDNFNFWKMVYDMKAIDTNTLRQAVKTTSNQYGEITEEQFKQITGVDFTTPTIQQQTTPGQVQEQPQQVTQ